MIPKEIKILSLCFFILFFAYNGVQQFLTNYFSDLGALRTGLWSLVLIYFSLLITNFFSGFIVSKFGVKNCLIFGSFFYSLFIFSLITEGQSIIYLASILLGAGASILWTSQGTLLVRASDPKHYGKNSGFFNTFFQIGSVFGIIFFGLLISKIYFKNSFLIFGILPLFATFSFIFIKDVEAKKVNLANKFISFKKVITNSYFNKFSLIWLSFSLTLASVTGKFPLEIKKYFGLNSIGAISPIFYFLPIILSYYLGKKSDIKGRKNFIIIAFIFLLLGYGFFMLQNEFELDRMFFILSFLLISFGYAVFASLRFAIIGDVASGDNLEHITALFLVFSNIGHVLVFLFNLYLPDIFSYLIPFAIILLSLIIVAPVLKLDMNTIKEKINL